MLRTQFEKEVAVRWVEWLAYGGHFVLLADTLFFVVALIDAQLKYAGLFTSDCELRIPILKVQVIVTAGYIFRCAMSVWFIYYKAVNMYDFVARKKAFPKLGAICAPFMSMLLLTVVVYDYNHCTEISSLIPVTFALDVIAVYVLILICLGLIFLGVLLYEFLTKHTRSRCVSRTLQIVSWGCIGFGGTLGIVVTIEQIRINSLMLFLLFDTYSFVAVFFGNLLKCFRNTLICIEKRQSSGV